MQINIVFGSLCSPIKPITTPQMISPATKRKLGQIEGDNLSMDLIEPTLNVSSPLNKKSRTWLNAPSSIDSISNRKILNSSPISSPRPHTELQSESNCDYRRKEMDLDLQIQQWTKYRDLLIKCVVSKASSGSDKIVAAAKQMATNHLSVSNDNATNPCQLCKARLLSSSSIMSSQEVEQGYFLKLNRVNSA